MFSSIIHRFFLTLCRSAETIFHGWRTFSSMRSQLRSRFETASANHRYLSLDVLSTVRPWHYCMQLVNAFVMMGAFMRPSQIGFQLDTSTLKSCRSWKTMPLNSPYSKVPFQKVSSFFRFWNSAGCLTPKAITIQQHLLAASRCTRWSCAVGVETSFACTEHCH